MTDLERIKINRRVQTEISSFAATLRKFGFSKLPDQNAYNEPQNSYTNDKNGWFADILNYNYFAGVWMVGTGLKTSSFPGGWIYYSVEEIKKELNKAIGK